MSFRDILLPLLCENPQNHDLKKFLFFTIKQQQKGYLEGSKVAQEVKALVAKANNWVPHCGREEPSLLSWPPTSTCTLWHMYIFLPSHTYAHK